MSTAPNVPGNKVSRLSNEYREFKAGIGWYVTFAIMFSTVTVFVYSIFQGARIKAALYLPFICFAWLDLWIVYQFLAYVSWSPFYRGPTLIADRDGIRTPKWFISWHDIEKIVILGGRTPGVAIRKKGQPSWDKPWRINGPLGESFANVAEYLRRRLPISLT